MEVCTTEPHSCHLLSSFSSRSELCQVCFCHRNTRTRGSMYNRTTLLSSLGCVYPASPRGQSAVRFDSATETQEHVKYVQQNHTPVVSYPASPRGQSAVRFVSATETQEHVEVCTTEPHSCHLLAVFIQLLLEVRALSGLILPQKHKNT